MVNLSDINPADIQPVGQSGGPTPASIPTNISEIDPSQIKTEEQANEEQYGTLPQTLLGGAEQIAQGVVGPLAPAAEEATGLTTGEAIRGRQQALGSAAPILQGAGLVGSTFIPGFQEKTLAGVIGKIGEHATSIIPEVAGLLPKIAETGIRGGAELAALQGSDELSKMVTGDPNQSLQTAAINIGLSGIMGGSGGAVLGSVSPLWDKAANKIPIVNTLRDMMGELNFLRPGEDPAVAMANETNDRLASAEKLQYGGLKRDLVDPLSKDIAGDQIAKHTSQIDGIINSANPELRGTRSFQSAENQWRNEVTPKIDPITLEKTYDPAPGDVFRATENFKRAMQDIAKPSYKPWTALNIPFSERPIIYGAADAAGGLAKSLENTSVWGDLGNAQKIYNQNASKLFKATPEFLKEVSGKELGENVADPRKLATIVSQAEKGKLGLKENHIKNFMDITQKAADSINSIYEEHGLPSPFESQLNPMSMTNHILDTEPTVGVKLARWVRSSGAGAMANIAGHVGGETVGGGIGFMAGHPLLGAWMGDKILKPTISALAKPFMEKSVNAAAARASTDYVGHVIKGQKALSYATSNFFKTGAEVLAKDMIPDSASRDDLKKSLEYSENPNNMMNVAGHVGHYLPDHATAATATASAAAQYFASIKPKEPQGLPFDSTIKAKPGAEAMYNRQLDIAQQPLLAIKHAKNGTILPQDIQTLNSVYPALKKRISSDLGQEMVKSKSEGTLVPYKTKVGLSLLLGYPVDSTMTPQSSMAVLSASGGAQSQVNQNSQKQMRKPSGATMNQINKVNKLYETPLQNRLADKRTE